jgi:hypothetical protein
MPDAFLESSVVIGLLFRHAGERTACEQAIPAGATRACSRYVQYEVARGFLTSLLALHNISFEYDSYADLHQAAYSGQRRFRSYEMHTWLGAFIAMESPVTHTVVTKNAKHFLPIAGLLGKQVSVAFTSPSTRQPTGKA